MTIDELLAREEIRNLRTDYSAYFDAHQLEDLTALFTEDAVCEFGSYGEWRGRQAIHDNYAKVIAMYRGQYDTMHVATNAFIRVTGPTTAVGRWYLIDLVTQQIPGALETPGGNDNPLLYLGMYEDEYRKVDGKWRIAHVKLHFLWPQKAFTGLRHPGLV